MHRFDSLSHPAYTMRMHHSCLPAHCRCPFPDSPESDLLLSYSETRHAEHSCHTIGFAGLSFLHISDSGHGFLHPFLLLSSRQAHRISHMHAFSHYIHFHTRDPSPRFSFLFFASQTLVQVLDHKLSILNPQRQIQEQTRFPQEQILPTHDNQIPSFQIER